MPNEVVHDYLVVQFARSTSTERLAKGRLSNLHQLTELGSLSFEPHRVLLAELGSLSLQPHCIFSY